VFLFVYPLFSDWRRRGCCGRSLDGEELGWGGDFNRRLGDEFSTSEEADDDEKLGWNTSAVSSELIGFSGGLSMVFMGFGKGIASIKIFHISLRPDKA
jgi:hypothetical protein